MFQFMTSLLLAVVAELVTTAVVAVVVVEFPTKQMFLSLGA
jgi:hypothetical protein